MFPWLLIWAPNLHFPWSGSVAQQIDPSTTWFFDAVNAQEGNGAVEKQAVQVASYGRQLGLITDVLIELADQQALVPGEAATALTNLKGIKASIETLKTKHAKSQLQELESDMRALQLRDPAAFSALLARMAPLLIAREN